MYAIAITDHVWFENLRAAGHRKANFWTPTPWGVRALSPGDRWYFMRKSPIRKIGGYGFFVRYREMKAAEAWNAYEELNCVHSLPELVHKIESYAEKRSGTFVRTGNPIVGCIELGEVVTVHDAAYVDLANTELNFPRQIVKYKTFKGRDELATRF